MTILRRAAPTRWLYPAILLLLFMEKSSAVEIAGYGGSASWTQISFMDPYDGDKAGDTGGILSFSQDGSRLLTGWPGEIWDSCDDVAVYEWQSGSSTYSLIGEIIPKLGSRVIHSASLSGDGNVVALGDGDDRVFGSESVWTARVFHYSGGSWQQVGSDIVGPLTEGAYNVKVSISSDGKVLAVGNSESETSDWNATKSGRVRIYQWPSNDLAAADTWTQMGETIETFGGTAEGTVGDEPWKCDVYLDAGTLSGDGTRVAVFRDDGYVSKSYVYEWKSSTWSLVGDVIFLGGEASLSNDGNVVAGTYGSIYKESGSGAWSGLYSSAYSGYEVSLSSDGTRVASGDAYDNSQAGIVVIQEWDSDAEKWMTMVQIPGISANDYAGSTVSLSGDGSRVAVYSQGAGHVRVFEMTGTTCDTSTAPSNGAVGNCPSTLAFGSSCQPECDTGYAATSPTTTCGVSGILKSSVCEEACDVSSAPANGGKGDCGDFLLAGYYASCTPTCDDGYVLKGGVKTTCNSTGFLDAAECRKRYSWGDEKFCPELEDRMFCDNVKTESDCDAARSCFWYENDYVGSASCYHSSEEWTEMYSESANYDFGEETCYDHDILHAANHGEFEEAAALCNALSNCKWYDTGGSSGCSVDKDRVKKIISDTGAPPGVAGYWIGWYTDACWYLPKSTCTTSTTVRGCELSGSDEWPCAPSLAKQVAAGADGCTGHADFEAVAALGGMTVAEAREKSMAKTAKEQAEAARDSILEGIADERLKKKAKLLADAVIAGEPVKKLSAKLEAADEASACSSYYLKASLSPSKGACVATAASRRRGRALAASTYDVSVFFKSSELSDGALNAAAESLKAEGVGGVKVTASVDPIAELKTIPGVDTSAVDTLETQSEIANKDKPPSPPPPTSPPPSLILDDDDAAPRLGSGAMFASVCALLSVAVLM